MWDIIPQSGLATMILDFTDELSPLTVGLVSLVWLAAGMIAFVAIHDYWTKKTQSTIGAGSTSTDHQEAA